VPIRFEAQRRVLLLGGNSSTPALSQQFAQAGVGVLVRPQLANCIDNCIPLG